jgi:hypothetical protein
LNLEQAEAYFNDLGRQLPAQTVIVLTGGIAASLLADARTTDDIDFAVIKPLLKHWDAVAGTLTRLAAKRGIQVQFSEDLDRWSSVTLLDWKKHTRLHRRSGKLEVRILDPLYFSIGKITRSRQGDIDDLVAVLKAQKTDWRPLVKLWAKALQKSPRSTALPLVKQQMLTFLKDQGPGIWGKHFRAQEAASAFEASLKR